MSEIADPKNDYNLNIPRYIDSSEPEDLQDLSAHLYGGIPDRDLDALQPYWDAFPQLRSQIFTPNRPGYSDLAIDVSAVQQAIFDAPGFHKLRDEATGIVQDWFTTHRDSLAAGITADTAPNEFIATVSDDLLARFKPMPLLDEYDVYEQLMTYWHDTMHDDVYLIMADGWQGAAKLRKAIEDKERKLSETPDLVVGSGRTAAKYKMDLIPPALMVARYFADEQAKLDELTAASQEATRVVEEYIEEHAVEDGLLADAIDDDKISKALVAARLKAIKTCGEPGEINALQHAIKLYNADAAAKKSVNDAQAKLDLATLKKYGDLTEADVKTLVLDDKWRDTVVRRVAGEVEALTLDLVARIQQLGERYAETLTDLDAVADLLDSKVVAHLAAMGVE
jgi:type I restriction enzyme M protein